MTPLFAWPVRVYWEDTDGGGVVYHAGYLRFLERARTEWLRQVGFDQSRLQQNAVLFVVQQLSIRFRAAARLDDELSARIDRAQPRKLSFIVQQSIYRQDACLVEATATIACVAPVAAQDPTIVPQWRPRALPPEIVKELFGA